MQNPGPSASEMGVSTTQVTNSNFFPLNFPVCQAHSRIIFCMDTPCGWYLQLHKQAQEDVPLHSTSNKRIVLSQENMGLVIILTALVGIVPDQATHHLPVLVSIVR